MKRETKSFVSPWWLHPMLLTALLLYGVVFLSLRMPSLEGATGHPFRRWFYFLFLLTPDDLVLQWFGDPPRAAWLDRLGILGSALLLTGAATTAGDLILRRVMAMRFDTVERLVFAAALGLQLFSTVTLLLGLVGWLSGIAAWTLRLSLVVLFMIGLRDVARWCRMRNPWHAAAGDEPTSKVPRGLLMACGFFAGVLVLASLLPPVEFDVLEYHLQAPKEFFEQGHIGFVTHNVYANMPLGAEMLCLGAMVWTGDWWSGALIGKTMFGFCALLTSVALFTAGRRLDSPTMGLLAALLYLSIPWVAHVSTSGLIEGVYAMYLFLAVYAMWLGCGMLPDPRNTQTAGHAATAPDAVEGEAADSPCRGGAWWTYPALAGLMAGSAAACKYPAVLFVVLPIAVGIAYTERRRATMPLVVFILAAALAGGAWYAKNAVMTGNPTHPLLYSVFGDSTGTWNEAKQQRWNAAHRPSRFTPGAVAHDATRVLIASEWLSPLVIPLVGVAFVPRRKLPIVGGIAVYCGFVLAAWWLLTHRIDRFWVPILPLVALAAALGAAALAEQPRRRVFTALLVVGLAYNALVVLSAAPGYSNRFFAPLAALEEDPAIVKPWIRHYNMNPPRGVLLVVGEAAVFHFRVPIVWHTCFDDSPLERLAEVAPESVRDALHTAGVTDILVDWSEIGRYRSPGNYGYPECVTPALFERWVDAEVLEPLVPMDRQPGVRAYRVR